MKKAPSHSPMDIHGTIDGTDPGRCAPASADTDLGRASPEVERSSPEHAAPRMFPALAAAVAAELQRRAEHERELMRRAQADAAPRLRRDITECRRANAEALAVVVRRHGWPTAHRVGTPASTAALMILLHAPDLDFRLDCRDLIAEAVLDGHCPAVHLAYIADHCAVAQGQPQFYGTRVNPSTLHPYPTRQPGTLDQRRRDVGLGPLEEQMEALRYGS